MSQPENIDLDTALEVIDALIGLEKVAFLAAVLLASDSVNGRTRLVKYVFLLQEEASKERVSNSDNMFEFRPFTYGPYSPELSGAVGVLKALGLINEKVEVVTVNTPLGLVDTERYTYTLTNAGKHVLIQILKNLSYGNRLIILAKKIRSKWDRKTIKELVDYVHKKYPEYTLNELS